MKLCLATRWKVPPGCQDEQAEKGVSEPENPGWGLVIEQPLEPMLDEAAAIGCCPSLHTQPHFKICERTCGTQPSLRYDDRDCSKMSEPEPERIDPLPLAKVADDHKNEAPNDKGNNRDVQTEHEVGKKLIRQLDSHWSSLTIKLCGLTLCVRTNEWLASLFKFHVKAKCIFNGFLHFPGLVSFLKGSSLLLHFFGTILDFYYSPIL